LAAAATAIGSKGVSNDKSGDDDRYGPEQAAWVEPLSRQPLRLSEKTTDEQLERELSERLSAVLEMRGLAATPEGWRELALYDLVQKGAPLEFVTDVDLIQGGHDGAAMEAFILRSAAAKLRRSGQAKNNVEAAKLLAKEKGEKRTLGTIKKLLSTSKSTAAQRNRPQWSRADRRMPSEIRVLRALHLVARKLEKITN
jgi:hypothetical protein